jgi:general secretion pathway protein E
LAQRLVRTLCPACKVRDEQASTELLADAVKPWKLNSGQYRPYKPVGCIECRMTGYRGRMGIYELLTVTDAFRSHVHTNVSLTTLRKQAVTDGMRPLRLAGALRASEGVTTLAEVIAATPPVD